MKSLSLENQFLEGMDMAVKKVELIEWLVRLQDEKIIQKIETLKKESVKDAYELRSPRTIDELKNKLEQSEKDILAGRIYSQEQAEDYIKSKINR
jgi:hypothetical protein